MPKDEFDLEDPLELTGVAFLSHEDTTEAMCECFVEEFVRMGYNPRQILAVFRAPQYLGANMILETKGQEYVKNCIAQVFALRGRTVTWASATRAAVLHPTRLHASGTDC